MIPCMAERALHAWQGDILIWTLATGATNLTSFFYNLCPKLTHGWPVVCIF